MDGRRKRVTVYDAVAGRAAAADGFLTNETAPKTRDTSNRGQTAIPPEEALFRRNGAPVRYAEDDVYFQHRHLGPHQTLPDSDLLKLVHAYASDFYARTTPDQGRTDCQSLDGTALIALGILLEEAAAEVIGETGDLAFVEKA